MNKTVKLQTKTQIEANSNISRSRAKRKGIYEEKNTAVNDSYYASYGHFYAISLNAFGICRRSIDG